MSSPPPSSPAVCAPVCPELASPLPSDAFEGALVSRRGRFRVLLSWRPSPRVRRVGLVLFLLTALAVPALTLPRLPALTWAPLLWGALPWLVGKYVICPLRWWLLSESSRSYRWHLRVYAESELCGLLTPGHLGADAWRVRALTTTGMSGPNALAETSLDRALGALGLAAFVGFAATALPLRALGLLALVLVGLGLLGLVLRRTRPSLLPTRSWPRPRVAVAAVVLSMLYQLSLVLMLAGALAATGHSLGLLAILGAFGASQLAGVLPGPHGASPRDAALAIALAALGVPLLAALASVSLRAALAWAPGMLLGGGSLAAASLRSRRLRSLEAPA